MGYHAQGKIGCKLAAGEVVLTSTGAQTTPFPKIDLTTNRKDQNTSQSDKDSAELYLFLEER